MNNEWPRVKFGDIMRRNSRAYTLGPAEDANLVGMRLYGEGPFHRELKAAMQIAKKSHFVIKAGDVIYNKLFAWKGTFGIVPQSLDGMFVSDKFPTYELDRSRVDEDFLRLYFRCPPLWEEARTMSTGSAALSKLTLNPPKFLLLTMPMPPLAEQRRLVSRIEELGAQIHEVRTLRQQSVAAVENLFISKLKAVVQGCQSQTRKLPFTDIARLERRPVVVNLEEQYREIGVYCFGKGIFHKSPRSGADVGGKDLYEIRAGDFILQITFAWEGAVALAGKAEDGLFGSVRYLTFRINEDLCSPRYLLTYMKTPEAIAQLAKISPGSAGRNRVLSVKRLNEVLIPIVPLEAQKWLSEELQAELDALKRLQGETAAELDALLPSILDKAFKGEL